VVNRKHYTKPVITKVTIDYSISLVMQTAPPGNPGPRGGSGKKGADTPFQSPFGDKPFG
jgi:hypothetical protein